MIVTSGRSDFNNPAQAQRSVGGIKKSKFISWQKLNHQK